MNFNSNFSDNSAESLGFSFIKAYNTWHQEIKNALSKLELTHPQFIVIASLGYLQQLHQEVSQVMISKNSNIDVMTVSQIIKNLIKKELVDRKEHSRDTRAKSIYLTNSGIKKMNKSLVIVEKIDEKFFGRLSSKEKEQLNNLFLILSR